MRNFLHDVKKVYFFLFISLNAFQFSIPIRVSLANQENNFLAPLRKENMMGGLFVNDV
jgi:hypothetical protein